MIDTEALRSLDEIERLDPDLTFDVRASQIMEIVGENPQSRRGNADLRETRFNSHINSFFA